MTSRFQNTLEENLIEELEEENQIFQQELFNRKGEISILENEVDKLRQENKALCAKNAKLNIQTECDIKEISTKNEKISEQGKCITRLRYLIRSGNDSLAESDKEIRALRDLLNEVACVHFCFEFDDIAERYTPDSTLNSANLHNNRAWCDAFNKVMW